MKKIKITENIYPSKIENLSYFKITEDFAITADSPLEDFLSDDLSAVPDSIDTLLGWICDSYRMINEYLLLKEVYYHTTEEGEPSMIIITWQKIHSDLLIPDSVYQAITEHDSSEMVLISDEYEPDHYRCYIENGDQIQVTLSF